MGRVGFAVPTNEAPQTGFTTCGSVENRDPELIAALDKLIAGIAGTDLPPAEPGTHVFDLAPADAPLPGLSGRDQLLVEADTSSYCTFELPDLPPVSPSGFDSLSDPEIDLTDLGSAIDLGSFLTPIDESKLHDEIGTLLKSGREPGAVIESVIRVLVRYANTGYERGRAADLLEEVARTLGLPRSDQSNSRDRLLRAIDEDDPSDF